MSHDVVNKISNHKQDLSKMLPCFSRLLTGQVVHLWQTSKSFNIAFQKNVFLL